MTALFVDAIKLVILVFSGLVSIINPPGSVPIFLAMTAGCSTALRHALARQIAVNVFVILVVSMFVGSHILDFFGLSVHVVQVGGGLLVTAIGWQLLNQREYAPATPTAGAVTPDQVAS